MALKENYKDDILDVSVNTKRKYRMTENADGTVSFDDETVYTQEGDSFGASDMNATNGKVNTLETDIGKIDDNLTDGIGGTTDKFRFGTDGNGNYGYIKKVEGADTFFPFSSKAKLLWTNSNPSATFTPQTVNIDLTNYESILVEVKSSTSSDNLTSCIGYIKKGTILGHIGVARPVYSTSSSYGIRIITSVSDVGVVFGDFKYGTISDNTLGIPTKIYGLRNDLIPS